MNLFRGKNKNKGAISIHSIVIIVFIFSLFGFLLDIFRLSTSYIMITYDSVYLAKKLTAQGGFIGTGRDSNDPDSWMTNEEIISRIQDTSSRVGIGQTNIALYVHDDNVTNTDLSTATALYKYGWYNPNAASWQSPFVKMGGKTGLEYNEKQGMIGGFTIEYDFAWKFTPITWGQNRSFKIPIRNDYQSEYFRNDND